VLFRRYIDFLRDTQGLSPHSIAAYSSFVRAFVDAQRLPENVAAVDALAVRCYLLGQSRNRAASYMALLAAALRSFLRFCFLDGTTQTDLSMAFPPVRRWQHAAVPPFLVAEEVERVIAAADRSTARGCRSFAILLLLARLGLRASEVIALELADIRWEAGEIVVRGKGRIHDRLPLLADVGEALALYLCTRGPSKSRRVFLRRIAPRVGLSQPADISKIAREALQRAGLLPTGRVGAHLFRHSLATRMIRRGASLAEISQVLRHRSITTTQLYAKVEFEELRGVALPWPSAGVRDE
jgi:site-specific recombinase XerD